RGAGGSRRETGRGGCAGHRSAAHGERRAGPRCAYPADRSWGSRLGPNGADARWGRRRRCPRWEEAAGGECRAGEEKEAGEGDLPKHRGLVRVWRLRDHIFKLTRAGSVTAGTALVLYLTLTPWSGTMSGLYCVLYERGGTEAYARPHHRARGIA